MNRIRYDNIPGPQSASDLIFIPLRFVVSWVAGYALRERAEQAEAAEMRATLAEREREAAEMPSTRSSKTSAEPGFQCECASRASRCRSHARSTSPPTESSKKA
jgi:hypothetical protein